MIMSKGHSVIRADSSIDVSTPDASEQNEITIEEVLLWEAT
jgi:hypothetical protein